MWIMNQYRRLLSSFYRRCFSGPSGNLQVTGPVRFINRHKIWVGNNVLLKRNCELLPSGNAAKNAIIISDYSEIHEDCVLRTFGGYIHIGSHCSLNRSGMIWGGGGVTIGNKVRVGLRANIISSNHVFVDCARPIMEQGLICAPVIIEDDVWIGVNVTILSGVTVGEGSIIGAGSVVTKNVMPYTLVAGVPAREIGKR